MLSAIKGSQVKTVDGTRFNVIREQHENGERKILVEGKSGFHSFYPEELKTILRRR